MSDESATTAWACRWSKRWRHSAPSAACCPTRSTTTPSSRCSSSRPRRRPAATCQGWEFVVVRDPDVKHQLARLNRQAWSIYRRLGKRRARVDEPTLQDHRRGAVAGRPLRGGPGGRRGLPPRALPRVRPAGPGRRAATARSSRRSRTSSSPPGPSASAPPSPRCPLWSTDPRPPHPRPAGGRHAGGGGPARLAEGRYGPTTRRPVAEVVHLDRYGNRPFR